MLKQLDSLTLEADGRYATSGELQFLKDYFDSIDTRISAYEKVRDSEDKILAQLQAKVQSVEADIFRIDGRDVTARWRKDLKQTLPYTLAAVLINDLDRLRDNCLLWLRTIFSSFNACHNTDITYQVFPEVLQEYLEPEELALVKPALQLNQTILS